MMIIHKLDKAIFRTDSNGPAFGTKKKRAEDIGSELYADGGRDAMENMFYSIEFRIKEEIGKQTISCLVE